MSKNKIILVSLFLLIGSISFRVFYKNTSTNSSIEYKVTVGGVEQSSFPS